jgi:SM-20-related protein
MMTTRLATELELFLDDTFLGARECDGVLAEMRAAVGAVAAIYGAGESASVDERVRKVARLAPARETVEFVTRRLNESRAALEEHFRVKLAECEEPQFLRYDAGGFFVAHQDGGSGLIRSEREARKVSVIIFLNRQTEAQEAGAYCGGSLVLHTRGAATDEGRLSLACAPGTLVAFRSATTHEVVPVTCGERYTIASWFS